MSEILRELLQVSEKAANITQACRQQEALFHLLIEEKKEGEKNKKFAVDFRPWLMCSGKTTELLSRVLSGNRSAPEALAKVVHRDVAFGDPALDSVDTSIPKDILGIWVDPIDSTYRCVKVSADVKANQGIFPCSRQCVTILICVYDIQTGVPLMGVINQPTVSQDLNTLRWKGECYWGLSYMRTNIHSLQPTISKNSSKPQPASASSEGESPHPFSAVISTSEKETIKAVLSWVCGDSTFWAAGAGYKSLCVVQGLVDV
ncbi:Inositol polyphosphate 1-phosphatase [Heterocephalus glaber]|uniref:Inositol polyphosphate 1-phosphatase n=1 Tax=Heterocephalus glaber TaxID=10181 RepID=G5AXJ4_HETGA|nr:Inositol polyphosphate 1-phosphatase [Heterocephalus glaber]